jgi:hypothetical protein
MAQVGKSIRDKMSDEWDESNDLDVVVRTVVPLEDAMRRTAAALAAYEAVIDADEDDDDWGYHSGVTPTEAGPAFMIEKWRLDERLPMITAGLDRAGLPDATLELHDTRYPEVLGCRTVRYLECRLAVAGTRIPPWEGHAVGIWELDDDVRSAVTAVAAQ